MEPQKVMTYEEWVEFMRNKARGGQMTYSDFAQQQNYYQVMRDREMGLKRSQGDLFTRSYNNGNPNRIKVNFTNQSPSPQTLSVQPQVSHRAAKLVG